MIKLNEETLPQIEKELGINAPYVKGVKVKVKNCWHFTTDGNAVDVIFLNENDFVAGMNRIFVVVSRFRILILAFCLMDTHVHFILYGEYGECNRFMHEYVRLTSMAIAHDHGDRKKLADVPVHYQPITDDAYLKTAICYVLRNPPVGGLPFNAYDYPWSSAALYFRKMGLWTSPVLQMFAENSLPQESRHQRIVLRTRNVGYENTGMFDTMVFPGEYVSYGLVEAIFKTCKSFFYFMSRTREDDVEQRGGVISMLSVPMQEMRQNKNELCQRMFGVQSIRTLSTSQRLRLAKSLKAKYNSSTKQIARLCGLVYDEVKGLL